MHIHYFQHVPFEGLGCIADWAGQNSHTLARTAFFENEPIPELATVDFLIVMGGPMGVNDEEEFPWLTEEKGFIRAAIEAGTPVLGICLGAQLIASALGKKVYPNAEKEIGWFPVQATAEGNASAYWKSLNQATVFHWHGDTFELPDHAQHVALSEGCFNQAFVLDERVVGLQFHLEVTEETLQEMFEHGRHELVAARYIQTGQKMMEGTANIKTCNALMFRLLDALVS